MSRTKSNSKKVINSKSEISVIDRAIAIDNNRTCYSCSSLRKIVVADIPTGSYVSELKVRNSPSIPFSDNPNVPMKAFLTDEHVFFLKRTNHKCQVMGFSHLYGEKLLIFDDLGNIKEKDELDVLCRYVIDKFWFILHSNVKGKMNYCIIDN